MTQHTGPVAEGKWVESAHASLCALGAYLRSGGRAVGLGPEPVPSRARGILSGHCFGTLAAMEGKRGPMHASLVTARVQPGALDEAVRYWRETILPDTRRLPGNLSSTLLFDRATDTIRILTLYATAADAHAAGTHPGHRAVVAGFVALLSEPFTRELYEVGGQG